MLRSVSFTGCRPEKLQLPFREDSVEIQRLKQTLKEEILIAIQQGARDFYCGMAKGIDLIAAELLLSYKKEHPELRLHAAIPYRTQSYYWESQWIDRYQRVFWACDDTFILSDQYYPGCFAARNRYLIQHCDLLIAVSTAERNGGTWQTIRMAHHAGKQIRLLEIESGQITRVVWNTQQDE